jgi:hypothetical protein
MRRLRMLMVAALAVASVTAWAGTAGAAGGSAYCENAKRLYDDANNGDLIDPGDLDFTEEQLDDALDTYKELEKQAPRKLRKPYRTVRKYYEKLADGDFDLTDPENVEELVEGGAKAGQALQKIYSYLVDECGVDLPDVSVPDVSIPDVSIPELGNNG